jgi:hypothetical protein
VKSELLARKATVATREEKVFKERKEFKEM